MNSDTSMSDSSCKYNGRFYKNLPVNLEYVDMKHVIGKKGRHLHLLCKETGVDKIWYNKDRRVFHIWGERGSLEHAAVVLRAHIDRTVQRHNLKLLENCEHEEDVCVRGSLLGAIEPKFIMHMIGSKGRHFKNVTARSGVSYIWYDDVDHLVEIWGAPSRMTDAHHMLHELLHNTQETIKKYHD